MAKMDFQITERSLNHIVNSVDLHPGAEFQIVVGGTCFAVYRRQTTGAKYTYYTASAEDMAGPSGRRGTTRRTWSKRSANAKEKVVTRFVEEFNAAVEENELVDEVWLVNPSAGLERRLSVDELWS
jgi:hypothetical protein